MTEDLSYTPMFDPLEQPQDAAAELLIRGRHSDGTPIPKDELDSMADKFYPRMRTSEWMATFGDLLVEENKRRGNL